jgi:hypothetical protein
MAGVTALVGAIERREHIDVNLFSVTPATGRVTMNVTTAATASYGIVYANSRRAQFGG